MFQVRQSRPKQRRRNDSYQNNINAYLTDTNMENSEHQMLNIQADG